MQTSFLQRFLSVASVLDVLGLPQFQPVQPRLGRKRPCEIPFLGCNICKLGGVEVGAILGSILAVLLVTWVCGSSLARRSSRDAKASGRRITEGGCAIQRSVLPLCDQDRWETPAWIGVWRLEVRIVLEKTEG
jgi:hypothetical protein